MGSLGFQKPWIPYINVKDCSQGFCSLYCQWCYTVFPPPPPIDLPITKPGPNFSPLILVIIGILASGFLLVSYYAIILKLLGSSSSSRRRELHGELNEDEDPSNLDPWHMANNGLDEALIKSITVCKYKMGHGLIQGTDCSVCLSEFVEGEVVKLLPKCSHAFHAICIDPWLRSHSNCPLCRSNIVSNGHIPPPLTPRVSQSPPNIESLPENTRSQVNFEDLEMGTIREEETFRNSEASNEEDIDIVMEMKVESFRQIRRTVSMDFNCGKRLSVADVLLLNQDMDFEVEGSSLRANDVGSSKGEISYMNDLSNGDRESYSDNSPVAPTATKRSFSCGRFSFSKRGKEYNVMIPL